MVEMAYATHAVPVDDPEWVHERARHELQRDLLREVELAGGKLLDGVVLVSDDVEAPSGRVYRVHKARAGITWD